MEKNNEPSPPQGVERRDLERRESLNIILQAADIGIWDWDIVGDNFRANDLFMHVIGQPSEKARDPSFRLSSVVNHDDLPRLQTFLAPPDPSSPPPMRVCELRVRRADDGRDVWVILRGQHLAFDAEGRPTRMAGSLQDVTVRKRVEENAARRDRLLTAVNEVAQSLLGDDDAHPREGIWKALDLLGRATAVDRVYIWQNHLDESGRLFTTQVEEWSPDAPPQQGEDITINVPFDEIGAAWERSFSENRCVNSLVRDMSPLEQTQLIPQGIVSILVAPVRHEGRLWGFIGFDDCRRERVWNDSEEGLLKAAGMFIGAAIARRQGQAERQAALDRANAYAREVEAAVHAKDDLLARISEEIRGPMRDVYQAALRMNGGDLSEVQQEYLEVIHRRARSLERLVSDLADHSRLEAGSLILENAPFDLPAAIEEACEEHYVASQRRGIEFVVQLSPDLPARAVGDVSRVVQIISNLVDNAVKYTAAGEVVVQVVPLPFDDGRAGLRVAVMDTGVGLSEEILALLNDTAFGGGQPIRKADGTGFGLSLAYRLARLMGGAMGAVENEGRGATFWVHLPLVVPPDAEAPTFVGGRALVVESNPNAALGLALGLARFGIAAETAGGVLEAAESLERSRAPGNEPYGWLFIDAAVHTRRPEGYARLLAREDGEVLPRRVLTVPFADSDLAVGFARLGYDALLFRPVRSHALAEILSVGDTAPAGE